VQTTGTGKLNLLGKGGTLTGSGNHVGILIDANGAGFIDLSGGRRGRDHSGRHGRSRHHEQLGCF
jgi:hypothetical protein